jgi:NADH-quinone oxidoreductase subunit N
MNFHLLLTEGIAFAILIILLIREIALTPKGNKGASPTPAWGIAQIGAALCFISTFLFAGSNETAFNGSFTLDPLASFFKGFFSFIALFLIPMSREFFATRTEKPAEFLLILWSSLLGLFFLVSANDFLLLFIALETFTLSLYALAAYLKRDMISIEAGLKYLILGSLASAFVIYGISLLYVATGSTGLPVIQGAFTADPTNPIMLLAILFILSGIGFKIAAVPFQLWVPDVYEGAPTPVVAYLSVGSKAAGFAILLRALFTAFPAFDSERELLFSILAAMTLLYGNLGALVQTNIKRLFGYSSIGHAGYLLIGIAVGQQVGTAAVLYYLMAYALMNLAAFMVITLAGRAIGSDRIDAYRGLAKRSPFLAATLFIALLSLAGVPPLAGFFGKFLILLSAIRAGLTWLAAIGAVCVAISLYYYLSIVRAIYFDETYNEERISISKSSKVLLGILIFAIILVGFWQAPFLAIAQGAASSLF